MMRAAEGGHTVGVVPKMDVTQKQPVVFSQVVEALFKHAFDKEERFDPETRRRLKTIGIDLDYPLLTAYSAPTWFAAISVCAEVRYPNVPINEAHYRLGRQLATNYGKTTLGRAVYAMLRMLGWKHSLSRISRGLQSGTNFLSAQTRFLEGGTLEVAFEVLPDFRPVFGNRPGIDPHFMNGNMDTMMALFGAPFRGGELQPIEPGSQRVVYLLHPKAS